MTIALETECPCANASDRVSLPDRHVLPAVQIQYRCGTSIQLKLSAQYKYSRGSAELQIENTTYLYSKYLWIVNIYEMKTLVTCQYGKKDLSMSMKLNETL